MVGSLSLFIGIAIDFPLLRFYRWGALIARWPWAGILVPLLLTSLLSPFHVIFMLKVHK